MKTVRSGVAGSITGCRQYRGTYCARTDPLPLLPSGPGGVGGVASRRTRHSLMILPGSGRDRPPASDSAMVENISKRGPQNRRSLGCSRDDKGRSDTSIEIGCLIEGAFHQYPLPMKT